MPALELQDDGYIRVIAVDPGTNSLGVAVLDVDIFTSKIVVRHAATFDIQKLSTRYIQIISIHGERVSKLHAVKMSLLKFYRVWKPAYVVSEAPYMGKFPQAYAALVECVSAIRHALIEFHPAMPLTTIDPATVKKTVGVSGKNGDKSLMAMAVKKLDNVTFDIDVSVLDEHSIDAIAVGFAYCKQNILRT